MISKSLLLDGGDVIAILEEDTIYVNDDSIEIIGSRLYFEFRIGNIVEKI